MPFLTRMALKVGSLARIFVTNNGIRHAPQPLAEFVEPSAIALSIAIFEKRVVAQMPRLHQIVDMSSG